MGMAACTGCSALRIDAIIKVFGGALTFRGNSGAPACAPTDYSDEGAGSLLYLLDTSDYVHSLG